MNFSAALLAGGRSSRMGCDKSLLDWHGRPLWRVQLEKLIALRPVQLFLAAREEQDFASALSYASMSATVELVNDPAGEDCGPIGAIARCLRRSRHPLLVLAVDMPGMSEAFLRERLLASAGEKSGVVYHGAAGYEPLAAVYPKEALRFFEAALFARRLALQPLVQELVDTGLCRVIAMREPGASFFANANTPDEAARLLRFAN